MINVNRRHTSTRSAVRRRWVGVTACLLAAVLALGACTKQSGKHSGSGAKYTIKVGLIVGTGPSVDAAKAFQKAVQDKTDGRVTVRLYPNSQLGDSLTLAKLLLSGDVQMYYGNESTFSSQYPQLGILDLPFLIPTEAATKAALFGQAGQQLKQSVAKSGGGMTLAGFSYLGSQNLLSKAPVHTLADLRGAKFRVLTDPLVVKTYSVLGATPNSIAFDDVYTGFQTGSITATQLPASLVSSNKLYEVAKYYTNAGVSQSVDLVTLSTKFLDGLPKDLRQIVTTEAGKTAQDNFGAADTVTSSALAQMKQAGLRVSDLPQSELDRWTSLVRQQVYPLYTKKFGSALVDAFENAG